MSGQSPETTAEIYVGFPIFVVDYGEVHYFYISSKEPLFYAVDFNEDGLWDAIYQDIAEDPRSGLLSRGPSSCVTWGTRSSQPLKTSA